jgi:hypothetical protein
MGKTAANIRFEAKLLRPESPGGTWGSLMSTVLLLALGAATQSARAQEIEPRAYSNAPIGVNFLIAGSVWTRGGLTFDSSVPITDAKLKSTNFVFAYARSLDLWGKSGKFDAIVPYTHLVGTANFQGQPVERDVTGFGRPAFRLSVNLHGAPALGLEELRAWKQDLIIGASLQVSPPWGQYDADRIVNIGSHRWSLKPEVGISKAAGPWTLELQAAVTFFTDNDDFFGGTTRSQQPLYSMQGHVIHGFASGKWLSGDVTYFGGGRSEIDDVLSQDLQQNWRVGTILAIPVDQLNSIKFSASSGVSARTGNNYDALGVAWQHRWGGGL